MTEKDEQNYLDQIQQIKKDQEDYRNKSGGMLGPIGGGMLGPVGDILKKTYMPSIADMITQDSPFTKVMREMPKEKEAYPLIQDCEYIIVGVARDNPVSTMFCSDAKDMQTRVALMKESPGWVEVYIFKRMLGYKAKVEWEAVEADV